MSWCTGDVLPGGEAENERGGSRRHREYQHVAHFLFPFIYSAGKVPHLSSLYGS